MTGKSICPICEKRRAERYCPAKGEKICAIDCGTEREVTIDCPSDCTYLIAAHRWEESHPKPFTIGDSLFPDVDLREDLVQSRQDVLSGLIFTVLHYAAGEPALRDSEIFTAVGALAETYRTLVAGIYYEKPPQTPVAAGLYAFLAKYVEEEKKHLPQGAAASQLLKDTDIFHTLVFFLRFSQLHSNGRPRSRAFLEFLRTRFPLGPGPAKEEPRIIVP